MSADMWYDVNILYTKFGLAGAGGPAPLPKERMRERVRFLQEELDELRDAVEARDLAAQADALVDLVVVALGTAMQLGLPWPAHWDEVHHANMAKQRGVGKRGMQLDLIKPAGWRAPDHAAVLTRYGYVESPSEVASGR